MSKKEKKSCDTCIENDEFVCIYKCNNCSHWRGCLNNHKCYPTGCELFRDDCRFGLSKNIECQG